MNRDEVSAVTHGDLPFANPLSEAAIDAGIAALDLKPGARVLDIGAGNGELLTRIFAAHPGTTTIAIEPSEPWAEAARDRGVHIVYEQTLADAPLDPPFEAVVCVASSHAIGGWDEALREYARLGDQALVGEGFWRREPSDSYLQALGGATVDELPTHEALLAGARDAGWEVVAEHVASHEDWARYEETLIAQGEAHLVTDPDPDLRRWVDAAKARWGHPDGKDTLGFTLLTLRKA
jgi:SAM-dependent methyltransferase